MDPYTLAELRAAENDYEDALNRLRALGHEPNVYRPEPTELVMTRHLYETLVALNEVAVDGVEARERDADGPEDRLNVTEGQVAIERAKYYIAEYAERYNAGDLK